MCSVWVFCSLVTVTNCDLSSSYSCIRVGTGKSIHVLTNGFWDGRGMGLCFLLPCSCVLNVENPPFMITNVGIMFQKPKTPWSSRKPMGFLWVFNGFSTSLSNAFPGSLRTSPPVLAMAGASSSSPQGKPWCPHLSGKCLGKPIGKTI